MKAWFGVALFSLRIYSSESLKDRRQVVRSLLERIRRHFNASAADAGPEDTWDRIDMAVSCAGSSRQEMESRLDKLRAFIEKSEEDGEFEILSSFNEVFSNGDL
jgi:uncharacterized protein YlxP (DUF503 family)